MFINRDTRKIYKGSESLVVNGITYPRQVWKDRELLKSLNIYPYREVSVDSKYYWQGQGNIEDLETETVCTYEAIPRLLDDRLEVDEDGNPMLDSEGKQIVTKGLKSIRIDEAVNDDEIVYINSITSIEGIIEYDNVKKQEFRDAQAIIDKAKQIKVNALNSIIVTTSNGHSFDGNAEARLNMTNAIISADVVGQTSTNWKLADNTTQVITLQELKEALALATLEVGRIVGALE